mgnify:CR=1 FL=1
MNFSELKTAIEDLFDLDIEKGMKVARLQILISENFISFLKDQNPLFNYNIELFGGNNIDEAFVYIFSNKTPNENDSFYESWFYLNANFGDLIRKYNSLFKNES